MRFHFKAEHKLAAVVSTDAALASGSESDYSIVNILKSVIILIGDTVIHVQVPSR